LIHSSKYPRSPVKIQLRWKESRRAHPIQGEISFCFQAPVQPGSMDSESGIFAMAFDQSGSRLITTEADKTIKIYREDETAVRKTLIAFHILRCNMTRKPPFSH